jgi:GNAT superfamily N-acetyltransferase
MAKLRNYIESDADKINELAVLAFEQYKNHYDNWDEFSKNLSKFSELSQSSEIIVSENHKNEIVGAVAYVPAAATKAEFFPENTPIIRMLIVNPNARGSGIGKALSNECIARATRDGNKTIALHTSPIMSVALPMYLRMGFQEYCKAPDMYGVKYNVYAKSIA